MEYTKVFDRIEKIEKEFIDIWCDVCNIESPTAFKEGVDRCGKYFADYATELGWMVEYSKQEVSGDVVVITMNPESDLPPVALSGHIDTVHPVGMFGTPAVRMDEDKIYGPGVTDCKGGVVAGLMAMKALSDCGFTSRPVKLLLQTDEEVGSRLSGKSTIKYICDKAKDAVVFLNLESHTPGKATLTRKGIISYEFHVTGKEGHSSRCVTEGANAVVDAAYKLIELDKFKDDAGITCNCSVVNGGTVVNTVPGKCKFSVNFRYVNNEHLEFIDKFVHELAATEHVPGCTCTVSVLGDRPAMEHKEKNIEIMGRVNEIFEKAGLPTLSPQSLRGGSDASYVTGADIPCLDSMGTRGGKSHSINEFAYLDSMSEAAKRIAAIAINI